MFDAPNWFSYGNALLQRSGRGRERGSVHGISRRDLLKRIGAGASLITAGALLVACGNETPVQTPFAGSVSPARLSANPVPTDVLDANISLAFPPELLSVLGRTDIGVSVGLDIITDPKQKFVVARMLLDNFKASQEGRQFLLSLAEKYHQLIGLSGCSDSRSTLEMFFPWIVAGDEVGDVATKGISVGAALESSRIGAQPAVFSKGVIYSVFAPHATSCDIRTGCGALGAIGDILKSADRQTAINNLKHHGVTQGTIDELLKLIDQGATNVDDWAREGARLQAKINFEAYGEAHFVAYGVTGHADNSAQFKNVIDHLGNTYSIDDARFANLKAYTQFIDKPQELLEAAAKGQQPLFNVLDGSRRGNISVWFGKAAKEKGYVFKSAVDKVTKVPLTTDEIRQIIGGMDYSLTHLQQNGNVLAIIADSQDEVNRIRAVLLTDPRSMEGVTQFLRNGGIIVETIPDEIGTFANKLVVRNAVTFSDDLNMLKSLAVKRTAINSKVIDEAKALYEYNRIKKIGWFQNLSDVQIARITNLVEALRPFASAVQIAGRVLGDVMLVKDLFDWVKNDIVKEGIMYEVDGTFDNKGYYNRAQFDAIQKAHDGANPYIVSDRVGFKLSSRQVIDAYNAARRAWLKYNMTNNPSPFMGTDDVWTGRSINDVYKIAMLKVPFIGKLNPNLIPPTSEPAQTDAAIAEQNHVTNIGFLPRPALDGTVQFNFSDNNQPMMVVNFQTGRVLTTDVNDSMTFTSQWEETQDLIYVWSISYDTSVKEFTIKFVNVVKKETKAAWRMRQIVQQIAWPMAFFSKVKSNINIGLLPTAV